MKRIWGAWVLLIVLPSCGASDSKAGSGDPGTSGAGTESGGSDSVAGASSGVAGRASAVGGAATAGTAGTVGTVGTAGAAGTAGTPNLGGSGASGGLGVGGASNVAPPDIPRSTLLTDLSDAQKGALCDWNMTVIDGYGQVRNCGMGTHIYPVDQAECIARYFSDVCAKADVGLFEDCVFAEIPSQGCTYAFDQCHLIYCL